MRKPYFRLCEIKGAGQRLCFRYSNSTFPFQPKSDISSFYPSPVLSSTARFVSADLVGNPIDRFSRVEARIIHVHVLITFGKSELELITRKR